MTEPEFDLAEALNADFEKTPDDVRANMNPHAPLTDDGEEPEPQEQKVDQEEPQDTEELPEEAAAGEEEELSPEELRAELQRAREEYEKFRSENNHRFAEMLKREEAYERFAQSLAERQQQAESSEETTVPDRDEDPVGYLEHILDQKLTAFERKIEEGEHEYSEQERQQQIMTMVQDATAKDEQAFREEHPDYDDAFQHVVGVWQREFETYGLSEEQIQQGLIARASALTAGALKQSRRPAEAVYQLAQSLNYQPRQQQPESKPNGRPRQGASDFERQERGMQKAGKSLSTSSGSRRPASNILTKDELQRKMNSSREEDRAFVNAFFSHRNQMQMGADLEIHGQVELPRDFDKSIQEAVAYSHL